MKRTLTTLLALLLCVCMVFGLTACGGLTQEDIDNAVNSATADLNDKISDLEDRLEKIESTSLTTIDQQIASINSSIDDLKTVDAELKGYIESLETTAADLQSKIDATNEALAALESDLEGQISASEQMVLNELNTVKTALEGQIATINNTIAALQAKDLELNQKIADLKTYVDNEITATEDWAAATFSTLEQYEAIQTAISEINVLIKSTQESIAALEEKLSKKIADDIAAAVAGVNADIAAKVTEITNGYTSAIADAITENNGIIDKAIASAVKTAQDNLQEQINSINTELATIKSDIQANKTNIDKNADAIADILERLEALEKENAELKIRINHLEGKHIIDTEGEISYAWSRDYSTCTATGVCVHCENAATEVANGIAGDNKITATFENSALEVQVVHTVTTYDELYTLLRCSEVVTIRLDATLENIRSLFCDSGTTAVLDMNGYGITFEEGGPQLTVGSGSSLTLKGVGTITVSSTSTNYNSAIDCRGTLFIEDGITINGNGYAISFNWSGAANISGGTINAQGDGVNFNFYSDDASLTITGGTFSCDPSAYVDTEKYEVTENGDGTWTVTMAE